MGLIELVKEHLLEEAKSEGLQKGIEKGMEKGIKKGIEKGMEKGIEKGIEKGQLKKAMTGLRNMSKKGFSADDAAAILEVPENLAVQVYKQLKKEPQIAEMLSAGQTDVRIIAEQLKVHPLLVEVIKDSSK